MMTAEPAGRALSDQPTMATFLPIPAVPRGRPEPLRPMDLLDARLWGRFRAASGIVSGRFRPFAARNRPPKG